MINRKVTRLSVQSYSTEKIFEVFPFFFGLLEIISKTKKKKIALERALPELLKPVGWSQSRKKTDFGEFLINVWWQVKCRKVTWSYTISPPRHEVNFIHI